MPSITLSPSTDRQQDQILQAKYAGIRFGQMAPQQLEVFAEALLIRIAVITGWSLPEQKVYGILVEQFRKKLVEGYPHVNPEEIEYACRNYGTTIQDWGKKVNLSLIDQAMIPYLEKRRESSALEERKVGPQVRPPQESLADEAMEAWLLQEIGFIKTGKPLEFIPTELYDYLDAKGEIKLSREEKYAYLEKAAQWRLGQLMREAQERPGRDSADALQRFSEMKKKGCVSGSEIALVKAIAKKLVFFDLATKTDEAAPPPEPSENCEKL